MNRTALAARTALVLVLSSAASFAQAPAPAAPAPAPAGDPARPSLAPPPATGGAAGPDAPVGKVTQELQAKLEAMMRGHGLTADEVARRAVKSSSQVAAKRKSIESAEATVDQAKAGFYPGLNLSARYTRLSAIDEPELGVLAAPADQTIAAFQPIPPMA